MPEQPQWILPSTTAPPEWFVDAVGSYCPHPTGKFAAQLLWQRGIQEPLRLAEFINPQAYKPASPFEFGTEMHQAVERLQQAIACREKVTIWGDFDADGITSTAVLWDGLGQFFTQNIDLNYYIPNRITESHGLNCQGIDRLAAQGTNLIVTCDTGSTNLVELDYAKQRKIDVIVTDHHTLPPARPEVTAIINPRYLPNEHQLFHLSGVAVAYKLVEGLYHKLPEIARNPLADLLDLVAIGLIADLVQLSGDCRYLAQLGIAKMQQDFKQPPAQRRRPGIGKLLELCQKSGDRPTDISFGLGPRINAVSRIQGDASFCVELLTSRDLARIDQLAQDTELANSRRKSLQKDVAQQVTAKLQQLDLSTTSVIVLEDPQWSPGVLGLVAGQVAQETGRPTILLSTEAISSTPTSLARGSARSVNQIDLYQLVKDQAPLLHRFGGHPFAAGLSIPVENIPLFTQAINQRLRTGGGVTTPTLQADLVCTVQDLGKDLFWELKLLEPCGMGNPTPKLLIQNCWFENAWHRNQQDSQGKKIQYIKTEFDIRDDSTKERFPGVWWGHYKDELPTGRCDCIVELDYNSYKNKNRYEIRIVALRKVSNEVAPRLTAQIFDWREQKLTPSPQTLIIPECPRSWDELQVWLRRSLAEKKQLALAWTQPKLISPTQVWLSLLGIAKYLSRTSQSVTRFQLCQKLEISDQTLKLGFEALHTIGFDVSFLERGFILAWQPPAEPKISDRQLQAVEKFLASVQEEQFQQQYFSKVPVSTIQAILETSNF